MSKVLESRSRFIKKRSIKCPVCKRNAHYLLAPFCSGRCRDINLGHWMTGNHHISIPCSKELLNIANDDVIAT